eukprot:6175387-Pleurochrysis_carterae.AAC.2
MAAMRDIMVPVIRMLGNLHTARKWKCMIRGSRAARNKAEYLGIGFLSHTELPCSVMAAIPGSSRRRPRCWLLWPVILATLALEGAEHVHAHAYLKQPTPRSSIADPGIGLPGFVNARSVANEGCGGAENADPGIQRPKVHARATQLGSTNIAVALIAACLGIRATMRFEHWAALDLLLTSSLNFSLRSCCLDVQSRLSGSAPASDWKYPLLPLVR